MSRRAKDLLGQVFRWEGEDYLVNDIAPGPTQSVGQIPKRMKKTEDQCEECPGLCVYVKSVMCVRG